jgi:hypothetical protein
LRISAQAEAPASQQPTAQPLTPDAAERAAVTGFRSARWGMTEAQVKAAIQKDFNISPDKVQMEENLGERTTVLAVTVDDLLEGVGKARVSYILGYSTKKLIQVNVVWGTTIDPQVKPERVVAGANQLRTLFISSGYAPDTVVSNTPSGSGAITVFQGEDADKHMTVLRLVTSTETSGRQKQQRKGNAHDTGIVLLAFNGPVGGATALASLDATGGAIADNAPITTIGLLTLQSTASGLSLAQNLTADTVTLLAAGPIDQTAGSIAAAALTGSSVGGATLTGANQLPLQLHF